MFLRILQCVPRSLVMALFLLASLAAFAETGPTFGVRVGDPIIDIPVVSRVPAPPAPAAIIVAVNRGGDI